jgi:putative oxidoreductase
MTAVALLLLRVVTGVLLAGHGAQKLFGAFGGHGPEGTGKGFEKMGLRPGHDWARVAGASEATGGVLTALGLLFPVGPIVAIAPMMVAWRKVHWNKPIWVTQGGAELPLTNITIALAVWMAGPGPISLDRLLGIRTPWWMTLLVVVGTATGIGLALEEDIHEVALKIEAEDRAEQMHAAEDVPAAT